MQGRKKHSKSGGTCIQGHPPKQKLALFMLQRGTLPYNSRKVGSTCPLFPPVPTSMVECNLNFWKISLLTSRYQKTSRLMKSEKYLNLPNLGPVTIFTMILNKKTNARYHYIRKSIPNQYLSIRRPSLYF